MEDKSMSDLHVAAFQGSLTTAQTLIDNGHDVNKKSRSGKTPLIVAARYGYERVCDVLLHHNALIDIADNDEKTALHVAAEHNHEKVCRLLLDNGAGVNKTTKLGDTPLHLGSGSIKVVQLLLSRGADSSIENLAGQTPLSKAVEKDCTMAVKVLVSPSDMHVAAAIGDVDSVQKYLKSGCDVNKRNEQSETPLIVAARNNQVQVCQLLLSQPSCDIDARGDDGRAALHESARNGSLDVCKMLLEKGATVDIRTHSCDTPLHFASLAKMTDVIRLLLKYSANPQAINDKMITPAALANLKGRLQEHKMLMDHLTDRGKTRSHLSPPSEKRLRLSSQHPSTTDFVSMYATKFNHKEYLGHGSYGKVMKAESKLDGVLYAIKRVRLSADPGLKELVLREVVALARLNHPHVVRYYNSWEESPSAWKHLEFDSSLSACDSSTPEGREALERASLYYSSGSSTGPTTNLLYMQLELCHRHTLGHRLDQGLRLYKHRTLTLFNQIAQGVCYIHQERFIHRDLKPHNILFTLDGNVIKIGDFGLSTFAAGVRVSSVAGKDVEKTDIIGTKLYMAPEQMDGNNNDRKSDVFSMGLILYEMLHPFGADKDQRIHVFESLRNQQHFPEQFLQHNPAEADLIMKMLLSDPSSRVSSLFVVKQLEKLLETMRQLDTKLFLKACKGGQLDTVRHWVDSQGVDIEKVMGGGGWPATHLAAKGGHRDVLSFLLDRGADVDGLDGEHRTPLHWAAYSGHEETVKMLLDRGASVLKKDIQGNTPEEWARRHRRHFMSKLLHHQLEDLKLDSNQKQDEVGNDTRRFLAACRSSNSDTLQVVKDLVDKCGGVQRWYGRPGQEGQSGLHLVARSGNDELVKYLLGEGWPVDHQVTNGETPLHEAVRNGHLTTSEILIRHGGNVRAKATIGNEPLHLVTDGGNVELAQLLVDNGADVHAEGRRNRTPLHRAATIGPMEIVEFLVSKGADPRAVDMDGHTPIDLAELKKQVEKAYYLKSVQVEPEITSRPHETVQMDMDQS